MPTPPGVAAQTDRALKPAVGFILALAPGGGDDVLPATQSIELVTSASSAPTVAAGSKRERSADSVLNAARPLQPGSARLFGSGIGRCAVGRHAKTLALLEAAREVLAAHNPMTVRQVYYQLVSRQVIENTRSQYQAVSNLLVDARKEGDIPWQWIEDRLRRPRRVSMWPGLTEFWATVKASYRRDVWAEQSGYVECWCEKDALSGIFEDILQDYGVTLNVGRGYDGWDSIKNAANRYFDRDDVTIIYFGDFDPSGEDMVRSLEERLNFFGVFPDVIKCALTFEDITAYSLPPDFTKSTDTRRAGFVAKYGDVSVELDALPVEVLQQRIRDEVESRMDMGALEATRQTEASDITRLTAVLDGAGS